MNSGNIRLKMVKINKQRMGQLKFKKLKQQGRRGLHNKMKNSHHNDKQNIYSKKDNKQQLSNQKLDAKCQDDRNPRSKPKIEHETNNKWYEYQIDELCVGPCYECNDNLFQQMEAKANNLIEQETKHFEQWSRARNRGDAAWLETIASKGTFADRLSAIQLRIQRSPIHALSQFCQFIDLIGKKGAKIRHAYTVTKALKELFINELLPPDRKLCLLNQRPLDKLSVLKSVEVERRLIMWIFEHRLKQCYKQFVEGLQELANNGVEGVAQNACREMLELLIERPEQEQFLLSSLVNKLGHPLYKVGSKVAEMLEQLVRKHPNMRLVVINEVERLLFRKNISPRAQRYALHFLSRLVIDAGEFEIATSLVQIYLRFFRILVLNEALNEHRLLPLLISGLNRAFPYLKGKCLDSLLEDIDNLYAIVQTAKFATAINVLRLLFQIHNSRDGLSDRFYCAFYRRLINLEAGSSNQNDKKLFSLIERVLKNDLVECRVRAFLKRLFQVALCNSAAFAAATLLTCSAVIKERPNLLRLDEKFGNGTLNEGEEEEGEQKVTTTKIKDDKSPFAELRRRRRQCSYNPTARNPLFSGADFALDQELYTLARHYHPTVATFARALINGEPILYDGDPLEDLCHMRFLDRLAFKNPKLRHVEEKKNGKKENEEEEEDEEEEDDSEELDEDEEFDDEIEEEDEEFDEDDDLEEEDEEELDVEDDEEEEGFSSSS